MASPCERLLHHQTAEEEARKAAERERRRKEKEAAKKLKKEQMGENYVSEDEEEEEGEGESDEKGDQVEGRDKLVEEPSKAEVSGPSSILAIIPELNGDHFWVSMVSNYMHKAFWCSI